MTDLCPEAFMAEVFDEDSEHFQGGCHAHRRVWGVPRARRCGIRVVPIASTGGYSDPKSQHYVKYVVQSGPVSDNHHVILGGSGECIEKAQSLARNED